MKNKFKLLCMLLLVPLVGCFGLAGCSFELVEWDINEGFDDEEYVEPEYGFAVSAALDTITISVSNVGELGQTASLVALPSYQYLYGEDVVGLSEQVNADPIYIDEYDCGTEKDFVIDRYFDDKTDGIYFKYYILSELEEILAGPMFCSDIEPLYKHENPIVPINKKGIMCEDRYTYAVSDLGCSYTELNFVMDYLFVPNEIYNFSTHKVEKLTYVEGKDQFGNLTISRNGKTEVVDYIDFNGQRYYFRLNEGGGASLSFYDSVIKKYTDEGVRVTLIMLMHYLPDQYMQPYFLKYPATAQVNRSRYVQLNTSNEYGAGYWGALMEFLGDRYSKENGTKNSAYGLAQSFVLGNEIDMPSVWNSIVAPNQPNLTLEDYMEEYERQMRIGNQALKKYYDDNVVLISFTDHWTSKWEGYAPKEMLDYITLKTYKQGNYNWGLAIHPYGINLSNPSFWASDTAVAGMSGNLNTSCITWSNLEVLQLYLEQQTKRCNGEVRPVYVTEGGVSSSSPSNKDMYEKTKEQQAAGIAYIYYKIAHLSCIKALIYYRLMDNAGESAYFGLFSENMLLEKPAYRVYKYIDTQFSFDVSEEYLRRIEWVSGGVSHGVDMMNVFSYLDTMALFPSRFNWEDVWDEDLIANRIISQEDFIN